MTGERDAEEICAEAAVEAPAPAPAENEGEETEVKEASNAGQETASEVKAKEQETASQEKEGDAAPICGPQLAERDATFYPEDSTINILPVASPEGPVEVLVAMTGGGCRHLMAGARSNVGLLGGRYMFETMIAEVKLDEGIAPRPGSGSRRVPATINTVVRLGLSLADSSLILGENSDQFFFDSEGFFCHGSSRSKVSEAFRCFDVVGLVVNLDTASPNANTVSLFKNGRRVCAPQAIPADLVGKPLCPAVTFRNVSLRYNLSHSSVMHSLPFKCHMVGEALLEHCEKKQALSQPGALEVVIPIGLPDEGPLDWVDWFLSTNKTHVELSHRSILDWAQRSGLQRAGGFAKRASNDKPEAGFGMPHMDDFSASRVLAALAPALRRNVVVVELKGNLLREERQKVLRRYPDHRRVAHVIVGEPAADFSTWRQEETNRKAQRSDAPDLLPKELAAWYSKFSLPSAEEGFSDIVYEWEGEEQCQEYFRRWVLEKKRTQRVEDLQPSEWFKELWAQWKKVLGEWKKKQAEFKDPIKRKAAASARKKAEEAAGAGEADGKPGGKEICAEDVEVFEVQDVTDLGSGEPLFAHFTFEDWALMSFSYELHLLAHAFKHDLGDSDRETFPETHLGFYYGKYYQKPWNGIALCAELFDHIKDTVEVKGGSLIAHLGVETSLENFVKVTEEHRRDRIRRYDAGDEAAALKFKRPPPPPPQKYTSVDNRSQYQAKDRSSGRVPQPQPSYGTQKRQYAGVSPAGAAPPSFTPSQRPRTDGPARAGASVGGGCYGAGTPRSYPPGPAPRGSYGRR